MIAIWLCGLFSIVCSRLDDEIDASQQGFAFLSPLFFLCVRLLFTSSTSIVQKKNSQLDQISVTLTNLFHNLFFFSSFLFTEHPNILHNRFWIIVLFSHHFHFSFQPLLLFKQFSPFRCCRNNTLNWIEPHD